MIELTGYEIIIDLDLVRVFNSHLREITFSISESFSLRKEILS